MVLIKSDYNPFVSVTILPGVNFGHMKMNPHKGGLKLGGRHSTVVVFMLRAWAARVRITAPESFSDAAVLIDSALLRDVDSADKMLNKLIEPIQY